MLGMSDLVNGVSVLLAFYVGYRYGLKISKEKEKSEGSGSSEKDTKDRDVVESVSDSRIPTTSIIADIPSFQVFNSRGNYKMLLVVRNDLKMGKGKIAAQCGHGSVGAYERALKHTPTLVRLWNNLGCAKIAVKVESEKELMAISQQARALNLNTYLVRDAGHTQVDPNTKTVLAIGPDEAQKIDRVTSHLRLL